MQKRRQERQQAESDGGTEKQQNQEQQQQQQQQHDKLALLTEQIAKMKNELLMSRSQVRCVERSGTAFSESLARTLTRSLTD